MTRIGQQPDSSSFEEDDNVKLTSTTQNSNKMDGAALSAISAIVPAIASKACCWGPPVLSIFGAVGSTSPLLLRLSRYRPYLLSLSASMISYSFYQVYGPPSQQPPKCCQSEAQKQAQEQQLTLNRGVAWASLAVAVAGATYGYVSMPAVGAALGGAGGGAVSQLGLRSSASLSPSILKLKVDGMTCGGCASKVKRAIEGINGVENVVVDHKTGRAVVDGHMNHDFVKNVVTEAGFEVRG